MDTANLPMDDDTILQHIHSNLSNSARLDRYMDQYLNHVLVYLNEPQKVLLAKHILELLGFRSFFFLQRSRYHNLALTRLVKRTLSNALQADDMVLSGFFAQWLASYYILIGRELHEVESLLGIAKTSLELRKAHGDTFLAIDELRFWLGYQAMTISGRLQAHDDSSPREHLEAYLMRDDALPMKKISIQLNLAAGELVAGENNRAISRLITIQKTLKDSAQYASWGIQPSDVIVRRYQHYLNLLYSIGCLRKDKLASAQNFLERVPMVHEEGQRFVQHDLRILAHLQYGNLLHAQNKLGEALIHINHAKFEADKHGYQTLARYAHYALARLFIDMEQRDVANAILETSNDEQIMRYAHSDRWYASNLAYALAYISSYSGKSPLTTKRHLARASALHHKLKAFTHSIRLGEMIAQSVQDLGTGRPMQTKPLSLVPPVVVL